MRSFPDTVDFSSYLLQLRLSIRQSGRKTETCIDLLNKYMRAVDNQDTYQDYEDDVHVDRHYEDFWVS